MAVTPARSRHKRLCPSDHPQAFLLHLAHSKRVLTNLRKETQFSHQPYNEKEAANGHLTNQTAPPVRARRLQLAFQL